MDVIHNLGVVIRVIARKHRNDRAQAGSRRRTVQENVPGATRHGDAARLRHLWVVDFRESRHHLIEPQPRDQRRRHAEGQQAREKLALLRPDQEQEKHQHNQLRAKGKNPAARSR
jgi:hypothetical protein